MCVPVKGECLEYLRYITLIGDENCCFSNYNNKELLLYFASYYVDECGKKCVNLFHPMMAAAVG
jgi:hypothetical protein